MNDAYGDPVKETDAFIDTPTEDDRVLVSWNEHVTYSAKIDRAAMDDANKANNDGRYWDFYGIVFNAAIDLGDPQIVESQGMENITFHDKDGNEI